MAETATSVVLEALSCVAGDIFLNNSTKNSTDEPKIPGAGGHRNAKTTSLSALGITLIPTLATAVFYLTAFLYVRPRYRNIYAPRTYFSTVPEKDRTPQTKPGPRSWWHDFFWLDDKFLLRHHSLEGYLFLRFFRVIILLTFVGCCITWPVLFPVNITGGGGAKQLDKLSFSNAEGKNRLYAHAIVAWLFVAFILTIITRERMFLIGLRQAYFTTKQNASRLSYRTVLFMAAPVLGLREKNMRRYFGPSAQRLWPVKRLNGLSDLIDKRNEEIYALESAEITLAKNTRKKNHDNNGQTSSTPDTQDHHGEPDSSVRPKTWTISGERVDAIDLHIERITEVVEDIETHRKAIMKAKPRHRGAVFVEYKDELSAYEAFQTIRHRSPLTFQPRFIGVLPKDVLWDNLNINSSMLIIYGYVSIAVFVALILLWSIPVGIVGSLSNVQALTNKVHFLDFLNRLPKPVLSLINGFVPSYLLSTLVSEVPYFIRWVVKKAGAATNVEAEKRVQVWYFTFSLIQIFLVTTFSSGAAAVATKIAENPQIIPKLLADNLPTASNFYLSYFVLQGLQNAGGNIINYSDLFSYIAYDKVIDSTPRQKYDRLAFMRGMLWGAVYPKFANLCVIAIAYSCIAPLMLGFATVGFYLFYLTYRYGLLYTKQVKIETNGDAYRMGLQHLMVGVYLLELCLFGLISAREAKGPLVLVGILLAVTILYHVTTNKYLSPLEKHMPIDVLSEDGPDLESESRDDSDDEDSDSSTRTPLLYTFASDVNLPAILFDPLASILEPSILASHEALKPWLTQEDGLDDPIEYTEDDIKNAYLNPALTSKTPKVWLARDKNGISKWEIERNKKAGLESTDEGAELDEEGGVRWDTENLSAAPIFKKPKKF